MNTCKPAMKSDVTAILYEAELRHFVLQESNLFYKYFYYFK